MSRETRTPKGRKKPRLVFAEPGIHAFNHPRLGPLMMARDVLSLLGYQAPGYSSAVLLRRLGIPKSEGALIRPGDIANPEEAELPLHGAAFLTRKAVNLVLMGATTPKAQAFREWLAGEVIPAILDTGSYPAKIN